MAKGNYTNTYATRDGGAPDWSGWMAQQEQLNMQQNRWNKQLLDDANRAKKEKDDALKNELADLQYGKSPEFKLTGVEALDFQRRKIALAALDENLKIENEIRDGYANGTMTPFRFAELKQKKDQLWKLPENLAVVEQTFKGQVDEFTKGLNDGKYLKTNENQQRLRRLQNGEYEIILDPKNRGEFLVVFDQDGDGELDYITMSDFMQGQSLGTIIPNINMMENGMAFGKTLGKEKSKNIDPKNGLYTIERSGLKFDDEKLVDFGLELGKNNPSVANSFAYQRFGGNLWNDLNDAQKKEIAEEYAEYMKMGIDEEFKSEFNSGAANYGLSKDKFAYQKQRDKTKDGQWWAEFNRKNKDNKSSTLTQDYVIEGSMKVPTYGLDGYEITVENETDKKTKIKVTALKAFPDTTGRVIMKVSDGTNEYDLNEADLAQLKKKGITRERIEKDFRELNKDVSFGDTPEESTQASNTTINYFND